MCQYNRCRITLFASRSYSIKHQCKLQDLKKIRFYILDKCTQYLRSYEVFLEKKFPAAMRVYRVFMEGARDFFKDFKQYVRIVRKLYSDSNLHSLTLQELEIYHQMPKDIRKVTPVLLLSTLPLVNYVIFPLAYYYPRQLLCRHFWNLQQRSEFNTIALTNRLSRNKPVLRHLQLQARNLKGHALFKKWMNVMGLIGSGHHPTTSQILDCKPLFSELPYHLMYISGHHIVSILLHSS